MFHFTSQESASPMATPGRHHGRHDVEQDSPSNTPTNTSRVVVTPPIPTSHLTEQPLQQQLQQQHSVHKAPAKNALLPDVHFKHLSVRKDAHGMSIRQGPGLAVAPPAARNPDQSVSMDISAEYGAQRPIDHQSPDSSSPSGSGSGNLHDAARQYGDQLQSPAQIPERRADVDAPSQARDDQHRVTKSDVQQQPFHHQQDAPRRNEVSPSAAAPSSMVVAPSSTHNASALLAQQNSGVYSLTDEQLAERLHFEQEIGHGNWGSIWTVQPRHPTSLTPHLPAETLAAKLCHRQRSAPSNARVRSLWNEFKVLKAVGSAPWPKNRSPQKASLGVGPGGRGRVMAQPPSGHPSIMRFYEFLITPSYAVILMPYFRQPMNVALPPETCKAYFQHLLSAVFWLHQNNVTHNDVKTANTMIEVLPSPGHPSDVPLNPVLHTIPILADFGFAQLHDEASVPKNVDREGNLMPRFCTKNSWGTPEYLSPERARADLHDERRSDLWSLGVTFFEIATGRTPFENEDEQFLTKDELAIYYKRTLSGEWTGAYSISDELEDLIRGMLHPDPHKRMDEADTLLHPYFADSELLQDAEENENLSDFTDDLDASLGAMVRAQVEAVKADRVRRQPREEHNNRVLDEPSMDVSASGSASYRSHAASAQIGQNSSYGGGYSTSASGMVSADGPYTKSKVVFPSVPNSNVEQVGHHSQTHSFQSRAQDLDSDASVQEDSFIRKHWNAGPSSMVTSTPVSASKKLETARTPSKKTGQEQKPTDSILSPVRSTYKKSQALISGAFHGTPMGKAKPREGVTKNVQASPSRTHAKAVISTPQAGTQTPKSLRSRLYQIDYDPARASDSVDSQNRDIDTSESVPEAHFQSKRGREGPGSPISLAKSLAPSNAGTHGHRGFQSQSRSAWASLVAGESNSHDFPPSPSASHNDTSSPQVKEGNRLLAIARTIKRSMSKSSLAADANTNIRLLSPVSSKTVSGKLASPAVQHESDANINHTIQQRRQQAAQRLERGFETPKGLNRNVLDSPASWHATAPASSSAVLPRSKAALNADGRQKLQFGHGRVPMRATSEVLPKPIPSRSGNDGEDSDANDDEEHMSDGRRSPTVVVTAQREKVAAAQRKAAAQASMTLLRPEPVARGHDPRRTSSDQWPSTQTNFDMIAGRLDAMSQHASSLLRLVEETRSSMTAAQQIAAMGSPVSQSKTTSESQEALIQACYEEADRPIMQSPAVHVTTATSDFQGARKNIRPFSVDGMKSMMGQGPGTRANVSVMSDGRANVSHVGEQSEGATLVGDYSSAAASIPDVDQLRGGQQDRTSQRAPNPNQRDEQSRRSAIATPLKAKTKGALFDKGSGTHKTPLTYGAAGFTGPNAVPSYATVRKHNAGWHRTYPSQTPETPSVIGNETYHTALTPGSPESNQWVKVDEQQTPADSPLTQSQSSSARFSMRRTRSFMLSALAPQPHARQSGQQPNVLAAAVSPPAPPRKSLHVGRGTRNLDNSEGIESPAAAVVSANRQYRGSPSLASSIMPGSSISSRPRFGPSPVAQVPPAVTSSRTPGKTVSRLLKLIRGGPSPGMDLSSVPAARTYDSMRTRSGCATDTTHDGEEYGYYSP
ncbi:unnamed protein product [Tilletia controversa]|uniref:Protein kinase domain-containing protein n=3 Tax=Tilletia TaxID=13289 RepID=A0A8X7MNH8_9BASI|nr:hypothetical protein CF336_g6432 [Tilletia laevis]KAE8242273.1 hypothetical protein A4X06_0g7063 [Tilletia controversa]KAE8254088.1 hypothetical protein A4X03_0g5769 [Tilletia caries]KAE8193441.1 hypothetical protein CF335_g5589 [Tilletia laevis]CAD6889589.1 unnamed protein product [Tilletia caries]